MLWGWGDGGRIESLGVIPTKVVKMRLALKCKLLIVCQLRAENPQSVFHAKHMIRFHKDNPYMPKCFFFCFFYYWNEWLFKSQGTDTIKWQDVRIIKGHPLNFNYHHVTRRVSPIDIQFKAKLSRQNNHRCKKWHFMWTKSPLLAVKHTNQRRTLWKNKCKQNIEIYGNCCHTSMIIIDCLRDKPQWNID